MFYIVETDEQLDRIRRFGSKRCFLDVITTNDNFHPKLTGIVAFYIRPLITKDIEDPKKGKYESGYIIPICHDEGINVSLDKALEVLNHFEEVYVVNKKQTLYHVTHPGLKDLTLKYSMVHYKQPELRCSVTTYNWFYTRFGGKDNLNQIVPISKIYEMCEEKFSQVEKIIDMEEPNGYSYYNGVATGVFYLIEQSGLRVDIKGFCDRFKPANIDFSLKGEIVYNSYNLYNVTSRPTNSFNAVNFLAIPKGKATRQVFKPQNDTFVEMDFDGYHVRLLCETINYPLDPDLSAHKQLASLYYGKGVDQITQEEYGKAKQLNFQMIYGSIPEEYQNLEISKRIQEFVDLLWKRYSKKKRIQDFRTGKEFTDKLEDMYPQKLMNYMIQSLETSRNIAKLVKILRYLEGKNTKVVLVTYDSFLIDWDEREGKEVIDTIREIMESSKIPGVKYPVKIKESTSLYFT